MEDKQTHGTFQDVLKAASPALRPVCESLQNLVISLHAGRVEVVWPKLKIASFGVGPKKMTQHYAYIAVQSSHINLGFYHGASLADPTGLLEGTGKELRHIKSTTSRAPNALQLPACCVRPSLSVNHTSEV